MGKTVVVIRCTHCMAVLTTYNDFLEKHNMVFIPSTLQKWITEVCDECGREGMEIYIGEPLKNSK